MPQASSSAATALSGERSFGSLYRRLQTHHDDGEALQKLAQLALQVEFATIPVYLTGMYSIVDPASLAYQTLRSVVMEEMFHLNLAANMVVALGGQPRFTAMAAPCYPGPLPGANPSTTPQIGLYRASPQVFDKVYAAIETPAPVGATPQADRYNSIAQLYAALHQAIDSFPGNPFEASNHSGRQRTDIYLGKFGGEVITITDKASACRAITQIVQQGEGTLPTDGGPLQTDDPFGAYNYYGQRTDGTYGPIVGVPREMSHFIKFRRIAMSDAAFPATLPITSNPMESAYTNPTAQKLSRLFNTAYSVMLHAFELSFQKASADPYFGVVLNLMHQVLPNLARSLMKTPAHEGGDGSVGPNATPAWVYLPDAKLKTLDLQMAAAEQAVVPDDVLVEPLAAAHASVRRLCVPGALSAL